MSHSIKTNSMATYIFRKSFLWPNDICFELDYFCQPEEKISKRKVSSNQNFSKIVGTTIYISLIKKDLRIKGFMALSLG